MVELARRKANERLRWIIKSEGNDKRSVKRLAAERFYRVSVLISRKLLPLALQVENVQT